MSNQIEVLQVRQLSDAIVWRIQDTPVNIAIMACLDAAVRVARQYSGLDEFKAARKLIDILTITLKDEPS